MILLQAVASHIEHVAKLWQGVASRCECVAMLLQAVSSRLECVKKDSELTDIRIASDEAVKMAETADAERKQIETCFSQEIHDVRKTYENKVVLRLCGFLGHQHTWFYVWSSDLVEAITFILFTAYMLSVFRSHLHSALSHEPSVPRTRCSTYGGRAFPVAAVQIWNSLPQHITSAPSLPVFCCHLKTYFFKLCYP